MNIWKVIQNGNSLKRTGRDRDGRVIILPPTTADEHIAVQRESKAKLEILPCFINLPDDHVADFHYMDDARIYGMQLKLGSFNLENQSGLELLSFDDLYYKLKTLEVDIKGYSTFSSSQSAGPSHSAFVQPRRMSDVKCLQESLLQEKQAKEEMTSRDIPHSRFKRLERRKKIHKAMSTG
ncbi:hypothetical protein Tco_0803585 [Tanacetum coccineum]|uniref:Uncharacterized protein n=1 Tax=Tanacetum coccineum TaxID=301880 RepID=A0ABQ5A2X4_9ASTR